MSAIGEDNGRHKLTYVIVKRLKRIYKKGKPFKRNPVSILNLSLKHEVSTSTMWSALNSETWK